MEHQGIIIGDCVNDYRLRAMGAAYCAVRVDQTQPNDRRRASAMPAYRHPCRRGNAMDERGGYLGPMRDGKYWMLTFCDLLNFGLRRFPQASGTGCFASDSGKRS